MEKNLPGLPRALYNGALFTQRKFWAKKGQKRPKMALFGPKRAKNGQKWQKPPKLDDVGAAVTAAVSR